MSQYTNWCAEPSEPSFPMMNRECSRFSFALLSSLQPIFSVIYDNADDNGGKIFIFFLGHWKKFIVSIFLVLVGSRSLLTLRHSIVVETFSAPYRIGPGKQKREEEAKKLSMFAAVSIRKTFLLCVSLSFFSHWTRNCKKITSTKQ